MNKAMIPPIIQNPKNLPLPPHAEAILQAMFPDYRRVVIEAEFGGWWVLKTWLNRSKGQKLDLVFKF
jgi:hypothetical protein